MTKPPASRRTGRTGYIGNLRAVATIVLGLALAGFLPSRADEPPADFIRRIEALAAAPSGLDLRIEQAKTETSRATIAEATPLGDDVVERILSRLPAAEDDVVATEGLVRRPGSAPPPRTGEIVRTTFPPPPAAAPPPPAREPQPLEVLRWKPEGEVGHARNVTVVFNQPMVPLTSADAAAAAEMPIRLAPQPPGRWSWLDTKTAQFLPDVRFPHSTTYEVEVPAGTRSLAGTTLVEAKSFRFETPTLKLASTFPSALGTWPTNVPLVLLFDQPIDAAALLARVKVTANNEPLAVRVLGDADLLQMEKSNAELRSFLEEPRKSGHLSWLLALAPERGEFPKDAAVRVEVAAGATSTEGPNPTKQALHTGFRTYSPLRIVSAGCWHSCNEGDVFKIELNNQLDKNAFDEKQISVSPAMNDLEIEHYGDSISLSGAPRPRTSYAVTISAALRDVHGQTLGENQSRNWTIGDLEPRLDGPTGLQVLEPLEAGSEPMLELFSRGLGRLDVRLYRVEPSDYAAFDDSSHHYFFDDDVDRDISKEPPGREVFHEIVAPAQAGDELATTRIRLAPGLHASGFGHVIAVVEPVGGGGWATRVVAWLQSTRLALDTVIDDEGIVVFVTELATGNPAGDVDVVLEPMGTRVRTDSRGIVTVPLGAGQRVGKVVARRGDDTAFVDVPAYYGSYYHSSIPATSGLTWYVVDDRGTYRPGEEVTLKGWLRVVNHRKNGDVEGVPDIKSVSYVVRDAQGSRIGEGTATVSSTGSFDTRFKLPPTPNLGAATIELRAKDAPAHGASSNSEHEHQIDVREFRRPEYEVVATASDGPHVLGGSANVTVRASYFAGGGLAQAPVQWSLMSSRSGFAPPGHDDYQFGVVPSWYHHYYSDVDDAALGGVEKSWNTGGVTDSAGTHSIRLDLPGARPAVPMIVTAEAEVRDVNRQAWTGKAKLLVHPGDLYVGIRHSDSYVQRGAKVKVSVIGVDHDGTIVSGAPIEVKAARRENRWNPATQKYDSIEDDPQRCYVTSGGEPVQCTFEANDRGTFTITATIADSSGRLSQSESSFWSTTYEMETSRRIEQEKIQLVADRNEYAPGDTARIRVALPFYPGEAVVTLQRSGVIETRHLRLTGPDAFDVAITEAMLPNVFVQVDAVGSVVREPDQGASRRPPPRPAYATGQLELKVPPKTRTLEVRVEPAVARLAPAAETSLAVDVRDDAGRAVEGAEVAVFVVDEAILALGRHRMPHPVKTFYPDRVDGTYELHSRAYVVLKKREEVGGAYGEAAEEMAAPVGAPPPLHMRKDFNPLAAFFPALVTGADGRASASFKLPDNVTRYRIFAVAASGVARFGKGESTLTAEMPLVARPSAPRFLNFGDAFELPVVVQNQTDRPSTVRVALRAQNLALTAGAGRTVTIPANDRVEVRFPAATRRAGEAAFQVVAESDAGSDAASIRLPVWTPATTESFATYGVLDEGAIHQPVAVPADVWKEFGGLAVTTSSTNLQSLTDAFLYLVTYPYDCGEQIASRMLAIVALQDVLAAFHAPDLPKAEVLRERLKKDVVELAKKQKSDGGFVYWRLERGSDPFLSIHATNALVRARARGIEVPDHVLSNALKYVRSIDSWFDVQYTAPMRTVLKAFALHVRSVSGDIDVAAARTLIEQAGGAEKLPLEAAGWLLGVLAAEDVPEKKALVRLFSNRATETAGAASFVSGYEDANRLLLASDRRTDGIALEALIAAEPASDLIPKVVTGLLAHRKSGRWLNTQENVYILLALDRYFRTYEKVEPDFVARLWLGTDYAGEHAFKGRTTESHELTIPTRDVAERSGQSLVIQKDGKGRLYYRAGLRIAARDLIVEPVDRGFAVERFYEGADDPADVVREQDGSWKIRLGSRVRVRVMAFNESRRYHVALVDPLSAGLEPVAPKSNPGSTVVYGCFAQEEADFYNWWNPIWYEHQNLRDERAEAFTALLGPGDHKYEYIARATTPGTFLVPPAKAEEIYMPETFGRSASTRVVVE